MECILGNVMSWYRKLLGEDLFVNFQHGGLCKGGFLKGSFLRRNKFNHLQYLLKYQLSTSKGSFAP